MGMGQAQYSLDRNGSDVAEEGDEAPDFIRVTCSVSWRICFCMASNNSDWVLLAVGAGAGFGAVVRELVDESGEPSAVSPGAGVRNSDRLVSDWSV